MPQPKDPYEVLGVAEDATDKAIKSAYRKLAQQYHPDRNAGDTSAEERFKEIQAAYDVLGDKTKRAAHDRARRDPFGGRFEGTPFGGASGGSSRFYRAPDGTYVRVDDTGSGSGSEDGRFSFDGGGGLGDIFDQFFGGAGGSAGPGSPSGRDVDMTVRLSFEDALAGGRREIQPFTGETVRISIPKGVRDGFRIKLSGRGEPSPTGRGEAGDLY
ncbi:MAG: DnaJ domain-containing protein, partial [Bacteroidota bacterium]